MLRIEGSTKRFGHTRVTGYARHPRMERALQPIRSFPRLNAVANVMIGRAARRRFCVLDHLHQTPDGDNSNPPANVKVNGCGTHEAA